MPSDKHNELRARRERLGHSQTVIAQMLGVSQAQLSTWERGRSTASPEQLAGWEASVSKLEEVERLSRPITPESQAITAEPGSAPPATDPTSDDDNQARPQAASATQKSVALRILTWAGTIFVSLFVGKFMSDQVAAYTKRLDDAKTDITNLRIQLKTSESEVATMRQLFEKRIKEAETRMAKNSAASANAETALKFLLGHHSDTVSERWQALQDHLARCLTEFVVKSQSSGTTSFEEAILDATTRERISKAVSAFGEIFDINPRRAPLEVITERGFPR